MEEFTPSRGIRQGNPLAPSLFVFCAKGLFTLLKKEMIMRNKLGVGACRNGLTICHFFFADDNTTFPKTNKEIGETP